MEKMISRFTRENAIEYSNILYFYVKIR